MISKQVEPIYDETDFSSSDGLPEDSEEEKIVAVVETPIVKFRRMARAVLMLIQVCNVCKDIVTNGVKKEPWYALLDNLVASSNIKQKRKGPRPFVTFVPNDKRELVQLTFDLNEFKKEHKSEYILTDEVREILSILPRQRSADSIPKIIRCMKGLFEPFGNFSLAVQKQICQCAFYDKYRHNRVIVKKGHDPDGIYFVLSGSLIEKNDFGKQPKEIHTGSMFGENDLICGSRRRHTVLTRTDTELLYLHRQDYREIFNMADDSNDPKNLDICKQHSVFQHFPMSRLETNLGTWSVIKYKYGRLIAKDNNHLDWIYVIKSGEARVIKYLHPGNIDVQARRKKVQAMKNAQSVFHIKKKILNFVEDREYIRSSYSPRRYQPATSRPIMSAPAGASRDPHLSATGNRREAFTCIPGMRRARADRIQTAKSGENSGRKKDQASIIDSSPDGVKRHSLTPKSQTERYRSQSSMHNHAWQDSRRASATVRLPKLTLEHVGEEAPMERQQSGEDQNNEEPEKGELNVSGGAIEAVSETIKDLAEEGPRRASVKSAKTFVPNVSENKKKEDSGASPGRSQASSKSQNSGVIQIGNHTLPAFVQVATLHPGQVFGLRSCLDPEERGPSVSLVSGECEVLQINKKFFMKHCDEAIYSLIRLKAKPFPSQEDLIDRLDVNMQWEEYKQQTMGEFLQRCRRLER